MAPFTFIDEIKDLENIDSFNDILKIMGVVFTAIPWTVIPYTNKIVQHDIEPLYNRFKSMEVGGWCGLNAEYFKWLLDAYKNIDNSIKYDSYNFGFNFKIQPQKEPFYGGFTHIGVTVELDGMEFFFDPYFARYFIHKDGYPLQFKDLLYLIREHKFNKYKSAFLPLKKPVIRENGTIEYIPPEQLLSEVFEVFNIHGLPKYLKDIFGTNNPDSLMLVKII